MNFFMIFSYDRVAVVKVFCFIFAYLWFGESTYYSLKKKIGNSFKTIYLLKKGFIINFCPICIVLSKRGRLQHFLCKI